MRTHFAHVLSTGSPFGSGPQQAEESCFDMSRPSEAWVRAVGVSLPRAYPKWTPLQIHPELRLWVSLASPRSDWRAAAMDMLVGQCCNTANGSLQKTRNFNKALTIHKAKTIQDRQLALPRQTVNAR
jgi:hypothetical protein